MAILVKTFAGPKQGTREWSVGIKCLYDAKKDGFCHTQTQAGARQGITVSSIFPFFFFGKRKNRLWGLF